MQYLENLCNDDIEYTCKNVLHNSGWVKYGEFFKLYTFRNLWDTENFTVFFYKYVAMVVKIYGDENMGEEENIKDIDFSYNKTDVEKMLEYCMDEYSQCISIDR